MSAETLSENKLGSISSLKASNDVDLVRSYLRDIGRVPLLSHEQEITLGRQVQEYMQVERAELEIIELTGDKQSPEELSNKLNKLSTIGIDLVAMCVNDLIVQGAKPLFFLDYIAIDKIKINKLKKILNGILKGCKIAKCDLIGGETAEMPGIYKKNKFDLAGFSTGIVSKNKILMTLDQKNSQDSHDAQSSKILSDMFMNGFIKSISRNISSPITNLLGATELIKLKKLNKKNFVSKGDDYQILFTANSSKFRIISKLSKTLNIKITKIGKICSISQKSQIIDQKGKKIRLKDKGYYHKF